MIEFYEKTVDKATVYIYFNSGVYIQVTPADIEYQTVTFKIGDRIYAVERVSAVSDVVIPWT